MKLQDEPNNWIGFGLILALIVVFALVSPLGQGCRNCRDNTRSRLDEFALRHADLASYAHRRICH